MPKKTILIVIESASAAQDFLESDFLALAKREFSKIVLLVPLEKISEDKKDYEKDNVLVEPFKEAQDSFLKKKFFNILRYSIHANSAKLRLLRTLFKRKGFVVSGWVLMFPPCLISWGLSKYKFWRNFLRKLYWLLPQDKECLATIKKHKPDIVLANYTSVAIRDFNLKFLKAAKKSGILTIGNITSWDQLTSKTFITTHSDYVIVQNENIKKEAMFLGDFREEVIRVVGIPRFDFYYKKEIYLSKQDFFRQIGADPAKKLLVFAGGIREFALDYDYFFNYFKELAGRQLENVQFYLRPYPELPFSQELKQKYQNFPELLFEKPWQNPNQLLANLLRHCDVLLCVYSTLMLEACLLDVPIINLSYFPNTTSSYYYRPERQLEKEHLRNIFEKKCAKMAHSDEELLRALKLYLENSSLDSAQRSQVAQEQVFLTSGGAALKLAQSLREIILSSY